ncbi:MAG: electron transfer flavoprotein subunit beta, partial [Agathobaculum butyriciproducens]
TNIFKSFTPPQKGQGKMLEGADKATCDELVAELQKKHII